MKLREVLPEQKYADAYFKSMQNEGKTLEEIRDICKQELQKMLTLLKGEKTYDDMHDNMKNMYNYFGTIKSHINFAYNTIKLEEK